MGQLTSDSSGRPLALLGAAAESGRWAELRAKSPEARSDMALSIEALLQQMSRLKSSSGLVGKVCTTVIAVAPSMAAIAWAVKVPWVSALALLLAHDALCAGHVSAGAGPMHRKPSHARVKIALPLRVERRAPESPRAIDSCSIKG